MIDRLINILVSIVLIETYWFSPIWKNHRVELASC